MFLLNSCLDLFSAPCFRRDPLFRSYGVNLPSSLTVNLSSALVCSTRPPVSVYGTGLLKVMFSRFSREPDYHRYPIARGRSVLSRSTSLADLPARDISTRFNVLFRQYAGVSLLRLHITFKKGNRMFTVCPSNTPCGFSLGPDLP